MMMKISNSGAALIRLGGQHRINVNAIQDVRWSTNPDYDGEYSVYIHWMGGGGESFYLNQQDWEDFIQEINLYCPQLSY